MIQIVGYKQNDESGVMLDFVDSESVLINIQSQDVRDFTARQANYTQTFRLPFTRTNNQFFNHQFETNIALDDISGVSENWEFNPYAKTKCLISVDTIPQIEGYLKLESVNLLSAEYEVTVIGKISDFSKQLGSKKLTELSFTGTDALTHTLDQANVTASWSGNTTFATGSWTGDEVLYPLADYGKGYYLSLTGNKAINQDGTIHVTDLKPAVKVKTIFDKIFDDAGYKYSSSFLSTSKFTDLYMLVGGDKTENVVARPDNYGFRVAPPNDQTLTVAASGSFGDPKVRSIDTIKMTEDSGKVGGTPLFSTSYYDTTGNGFYTPPFDGEIRIGLSGQIRIEQIGAGYYGLSDTVIFWLHDKVADVRVSNIITKGVNLTGKSGNVIVQINGSFTVQATTSMEIELRLDQALSSATDIVLNTIGVRVQLANVFVTTSTTLRTNYFASLPESSYDPLSIFPTMEQKEFVKAFVNLFNLSIEPSEEDDKLLYIEPYNDWIDDGDEIDWSNKIDLSKEIVLKPLHDIQAKKLRFKFSDDADLLNDRYQKTYNKGYGEAIIETGKDFGKDEEVVEIPFSPLIPQKLVNAQTLSMPYLYQLEEGKPKAVKTKPKLFYFAGTRTCDEYQMEDATSGDESYTTMPVCGHFDDDPVGAEDNDLMFGLSTPFDNRGLTQNTSYNNYWARWVNEIYSTESRMLIAYFNLSSQDILNLRLNNKVWVKDAFYRINKVDSHPVGERASTRVELLKILPTPSFECSVEIDSISFESNGVVKYDSLEANNLDLPRDCCFKFGYFWFEDKCLWSPPLPAEQETNPNSSLAPFIAGNNIAVNGENNFAAGANHTVSSNDSLVLGDGIDAIGEGSVFLGKNHAIGEDAKSDGGFIISGQYGKKKRLGESSIQGAGVYGTAGAHQSSTIVMGVRTDGEYASGDARFYPTQYDLSTTDPEDDQPYGYIRIDSNSAVEYTIKVIGYRAADGEHYALHETGLFKHNGTTLSRIAINTDTDASTQANTYWTVSVSADTTADAISVVVENTNGADTTNAIKWTCELNLTEVA